MVQLYAPGGQIMSINYLTSPVILCALEYFLAPLRGLAGAVVVNRACTLGYTLAPLRGLVRAAFMSYIATRE